MSKLELWRWAFSSDWCSQRSGQGATGKAFHSKALPQLSSHDVSRRNGAYEAAKWGLCSALPPCCHELNLFNLIEHFASFIIKNKYYKNKLCKQSVVYIKNLYKIIISNLCGGFQIYNTRV